MPRHFRRYNNNNNNELNFVRIFGEALRYEHFRNAFFLLEYLWSLASQGNGGAPPIALFCIRNCNLRAIAS